MKNPERVAELLAELRALSESDFERHRIDVLERDLHEPPAVEVIDETHQRFNGVTYKQGNHGHYSVMSAIHRVVWSYFHGEIPCGDYVIHHVDQNKGNNAIENLMLMTNAEHKRLHFNLSESHLFTCKFCGKKYYSKTQNQKSKFCSRKCKLNWELNEHGETVKCEICGKSFKRRKNSNTKCCSSTCAAKLREKIKRAKKTTNSVLEKTCLVCGKSFFNASWRNVQTCSRSCATKLGRQRRAQSLIQKKS